MNETPLKIRHRLQSCSLRTLLLITTVCCVALSTWRFAVRPYQRQEYAAKQIQDMGGSVRMRPAGSSWLAWLVGKEQFNDVIEVDMHRHHDGGEYSRLLANFPRLETLRVGFNFTDEDMIWLAKCKELRRLFFEHTQITDRGLRVCNNFPHLRIALLGRNITDDGLSVLQDKRALAYIDLSNTQVTDDGLKHLRRLPILHKVFVNGRPITGKGLAHLQAIPRLDELYLVGCTEVWDDDFRKLAAHTKLKQLDVSNTRISDATVRLLQEKLTRCRILREYGRR